jgi:hypothetical protein
LFPHIWITFNLGVGLREDVVVPRISVAFIWARFVVESKIPEDSRPCWIGGANLGPPVEKSIRLVEIGGLGYVRGDDPIILANLGDTIYLNGEQHRDAILS